MQRVCFPEENGKSVWNINNKVNISGKIIMQTISPTLRFGGFFVYIETKMQHIGIVQIIW